MTNRLTYRWLALGLAVAFTACGEPEKPAAGSPAGSEPDTATTAQPAGSTEQMEVASPGGEFSMKFPAGFSAPKQTTAPIKSEMGTLQTTVYSSTKGNDDAFMMAYTPYPDSMFTGDVGPLLDKARDVALGSLKANIARETNITNSGYPGRSVIFTGTVDNRDIYGRVDYFIAKPHLYEILYLTHRRENLEDSAVVASFASFSMRENAPPMR